MAEDHELKIDSQEDAIKAIGDIHNRVKDLKSSADDRTAELDAWKTKMVDDLKHVSQRMTELSNASVPTNAGGDDSEFKAFVDEANETGLAAKTKGVIFKGGQTPDGEWRPGLFDADVEPVNEWHERALQLVDQRNMVRAMRRGPTPYARGESPISDKQLARHMERAPQSIKRIFGDAADIGAEWIPDQHMPTLERDLRLARRVEALFQSVPMSDKELKLPFLSSQGITPYVKGVSVTDDPAQYRSSSMTTKKLDLTAVGLACRSQLDEDASEDSIIDSQGITRAELVAALTDGKEDAIINGDTAGTHQDDLANPWNPRSRWASAPLGGSDDHRRLWLGLRAQAFDNSATTDGNAAQTFAGYLTALKIMDAPHGVAGDTVTIVSPEYWITMLGFAEVLTLDKFGPQSTILTGQLGSIGGRPVVMSEFLTTDLAATGLFTGSGSQTAYLITNRARFKMGVRRGMSVELDKDITRGIFNMVSTVRGLFFDLDTPVSKKNNVYVFNVD